MVPPYTQTYGARAKNFSNASAKQLLQIMEKKKTNLCVSVDLTETHIFLQVVDIVGPFVCMIKTHVDIMEDFDQSFIDNLTQLSQKHDFMIFEDRKFADIGNTVRLQYSRGIHKIASWSHFTNAHAIPGPSVITGLASVGLPLGRGLFLLAEMSSEGNLATGEYTIEAVNMARKHRDFVIGFIAQRRIESSSSTQSDIGEDFLVLTPGISLDNSGDGMGQQYRTPHEVIQEAGCDIIIAGRSIYGRNNSIDLSLVRLNAENYRSVGWQAYLSRLS